jgi:hypothetical protein
VVLSYSYPGVKIPFLKIVVAVEEASSFSKIETCFSTGFMDKIPLELSPCMWYTYSE